MWREGQSWQKAKERYSISETIKDKMSQLTAWCVIKVIPILDHTGMLFAPLTLLHYPHSRFLWISHFGDLPSFLLACMDWSIPAFHLILFCSLLSLSWPLGGHSYKDILQSNDLKDELLWPFAQKQIEKQFNIKIWFQLGEKRRKETFSLSLHGKSTGDINKLTLICASCREKHQ